MNASREARLAAYAALLRKWNPSINLIAPGTVPDLERRHLQDSAQLASLVVDPWDGLWLDIGSGGGLPGLVVAIHHPDSELLLVDSDRRKVAFLQTAIRELGLSQCRATAGRIEDLAPASARHLSARALAPLPRLMPYLDRHLAADGTAWLMKGQNWQAELDQSEAEAQFDILIHRSLTDPAAAILQCDRKTT